MKIETKLSIGDVGYKVSKVCRDIHLTCKLCRGNGLVLIRGADRKATCPDCFGQGFSWGEEKEHHVVESLGIGQVRVTVQAEIIDVSYMCHETGIGSGTVHKDKDFFVTRAEAAVECERRDAEL